MMPLKLWRSWVELFEEEGDDEPRFDPIHLATILVACQVVVGALFWLLWTTMVYEGGFASGEGWFGNIAALITLAAALEALRRADRRHARKTK